MKKSRFTEEKMVEILREADQSPVQEVAKKHGISDQTIYGWRKRFGQLEALWTELRGARTTDYRARQRFRLVPRGNAQCRSTRGFQRPRALFYKSDR